MSDSYSYRIAGNFWGRKLSRIGEKHNFCGENFRRLLTFAVPKVPHCQILRRKLSRIAPKPQNSLKFSPSKVSHYTVALDALWCRWQMRTGLQGACQAAIKWWMTVVYASYSLRMEGEVVKESVVRGHHIYEEVWRPVIAQALPVLPESNNHHDRWAVAIIIWMVWL